MDQDSPLDLRSAIAFGAPKGIICFYRSRIHFTPEKPQPFSEIVTTRAACDSAGEQDSTVATSLAIAPGEINLPVSLDCLVLLSGATVSAIISIDLPCCGSLLEVI